LPRLSTGLSARLSALGLLAAWLSTLRLLAAWLSTGLAALPVCL